MGKIKTAPENAYVEFLSDDDSVEYTAQPRMGLPASKAERKARTALGAVLLALPLAALAILISFGAIAAAAAGGKSKAAEVETFKYEAAARSVVVDYMSGRVPSIPAAINVNAFAARESTNNTGVASAPTPVPVLSISSLSAETINIKDRSIEVHEFLVRTDAGLLEVSVTILDADGPVLAALPSIKPADVGVPPEDAAFSWDAVFGQAVLDQDIAIEQVAKWADAYGADDADALYRLTNDPENHLYRGIGGLQSADQPVIKSAATFNKTQVLLTVTVTLRSTRNAALVLKSDYDLLLDDLDRAVPSIVAWGPAGTGPTLVPFSNAYEPGEETTPDKPTGSGGFSTVSTTTAPASAPSDAGA